MGVSKAHAGEEEPRERLACVDGNPVDEIAVEEGDLLRGAGFIEATKDQALVGQGIQVSLQGTDLALSRSVLNSSNEQRATSNEKRR